MELTQPERLRMDIEPKSHSKLQTPIHCSFRYHATDHAFQSMTRYRLKNRKAIHGINKLAASAEFQSQDRIECQEEKVGYCPMAGEVPRGVTGGSASG